VASVSWPTRPPGQHVLRRIRLCQRRFGQVGHGTGLRGLGRRVQRRACRACERRRQLSQHRGKQHRRPRYVQHHRDRGDPRRQQQPRRRPDGHRRNGSAERSSRRRRSRRAQRGADAMDLSGHHSNPPAPLEALLEGASCDPETRLKAPEDARTCPTAETIGIAHPRQRCVIDAVSQVLRDEG